MERPGARSRRSCHRRHGSWPRRFRRGAPRSASRSRARGRNRARCGLRPSGRSGRTRGAGRRRGCPGRRSRTSMRRPSTATSIGPSLYLIALSTRFVIARSAMCGRTSTATLGSSWPSDDRRRSRPVRRCARSADVVGERSMSRVGCGRPRRSTDRWRARRARRRGRSARSTSSRMPCTARLPLSAVELVGAVEELGVRAQARERRAQLVARVGDELLLLARDAASASTIVEKLRGEAPDLAAAVLGDRRVEILGAGDALGGVAQALDRADEAAGEQPAESGGRGDGRRGSATTRRSPRASQHVGVLVERAGRLQHRAVGPGMVSTR